MSGRPVVCRWVTCHQLRLSARADRGAVKRGDGIAPREGMAPGSAGGTWNAVITLAHVCGMARVNTGASPARGISVVSSRVRLLPGPSGPARRRVSSTSPTRYVPVGLATRRPDVALRATDSDFLGAAVTAMALGATAASPTCRPVSSLRRQLVRRGPGSRTGRPDARRAGVLPVEAVRPEGRAGIEGYPDEPEACQDDTAPGPARARGPKPGSRRERRTPGPSHRVRRPITDRRPVERVGPSGRAIPPPGTSAVRRPRRSAGRVRPAGPGSSATRC